MFSLDLHSGDLDEIFQNIIEADSSLFSYINKKDDHYYISTTQMTDDNVIYKVYETTLKGKHEKLIVETENVRGTLPFCTVAIINDRLFVGYPYSGLDIDIIDLD